MSNLVRMFLVAVTLLIALDTVSAQRTLTARNSPVQPPSSTPTVESDRARDGLVGPVRRVRTEIVKLANEGNRLVEGKRTLVEMVTYDIRGNKVENQYFPVPGGALSGKEVYKYDEKGNISEMTLLNDDGSLLSQEIYKYEFDFAGNWNKMTTSVAAVEGGKLVFEPSEVTYRSIMYYLDANMMKMVSPSPATLPAQPPVNDSPVAAKQSDKSGKLGQPLPSASVNLEDVNALSSADVKTVSATSSAANPRVVLDTEPPPTPKPILKPISGGVLNGSAISLPAPIYPDAAKRMRVSGTIVVEVVIDETGKVIAAKATGGPASLADAAVNAALRARFSPTKLSGQPVKVSGVINYKFSLTP